MKRENLESKEFSLIIASRNFPFYAAPEADAVMDELEERIKELEAENERLKAENEKLEKKLKKAENAFCVAHLCINRATIGCRKNCRKMEEFLFMIEEED